VNSLCRLSLMLRDYFKWLECEAFVVVVLKKCEVLFELWGRNDRGSHRCLRELRSQSRREPQMLNKFFRY